VEFFILQNWDKTQWEESVVAEKIFYEELIS
jgi:hypothetical protein